MPSIVTLAEADAAATFYPDMQVWFTNLATGTHQELNWVKFVAGSTYPLHSHPYEQTSIVVQGRMRLTVGDEVGEVGGRHVVRLGKHAPWRGPWEMRTSYSLISIRPRVAGTIVL